MSNRVSLRDNHRLRVYRAEQRVRDLFDAADHTGERTIEVFDARITMPVEKRMADLEQAAAYLDGVLALRAVRRRLSRAGIAVTIRARKGHTAAHYEPDTHTIAIPMQRPSEVRELLLLHELAHHLQPPVSVAHGPQFCRVYCDLVRRVLGPEPAWLLRACLIDSGASYH
ncbi:TIGR04338 family metallohydrolase [Nocardia suismassiliense]|uniref:TIGR04338 family metallohydrolase n=1 Tax=Nocardia suismassiliense TaxID=2077092 RepID=A0ABW6R823_9NOCA